MAPPIQRSGADRCPPSTNRRDWETLSLRDQAADPARFAASLGASFARHGFAVIADSGLDPAHVDAALRATHAVFALPEATKRRYQIPGGGGQRGYTPFALETAKGGRHADLKEFWHVGQSDNVWPDEIADFRGETLWLFHALETLGIRLMRAIADHLGEPADTFEAAVTGGDSILRLLHYPPAGFDGPAIRAGAHEDINAITLLLGAEEAGLEILDRDGRWLAIDPPPGAVVVNIGDMLARLTNDVLPSTTHRVVNPAPERRERGAVLDAVLPALPAAVRDRDPAGVRERQPPKPLPRTDHGGGIFAAEAAGDWVEVAEGRRPRRPFPCDWLSIGARVGGGADPPNPARNPPTRPAPPSPISHRSARCAPARRRPDDRRST